MAEFRAGAEKSGTNVRVSVMERDWRKHFKFLDLIVVRASDLQTNEEQNKVNNNLKINKLKDFVWPWSQKICCALRFTLIRQLKVCAFNVFSNT